jgi:hypothetical protein
MLMKGGKKAARKLMRTVPGAAGRAQRAWTRVRTNALVVAGFGAIDYGVYELAGNWCWIAVGLSLLLVEVLNESDDDTGSAEESQ